MTSSHQITDEEVTPILLRNANMKSQFKCSDLAGRALPQQRSLKSHILRIAGRMLHKEQFLRISRQPSWSKSCNTMALVNTVSIPCSCYFLAELCPRIRNAKELAKFGFGHLLMLVTASISPKLWANLKEKSTQALIMNSYTNEVLHLSALTTRRDWLCVWPRHTHIL